jgi:hypothetical protein
MFGKLLSKTIKIVTLPIDAVNTAQDIAFGRSGSKWSRTDPSELNPFGDLERLRDRIADTAEDIDT